MKKIALFLIALSSAALITTTALATPCATKNPGHQGKYMDSHHGAHQGGYHNMARGQNFHGKQFHGKQHRHWQKLTQEQRDQLRTLHQQFIDETITQRTTIANLYNELQMLMETSAPDRNKLVTLIKQIEPLKTEMAIKRIELQLKAKKIAPELPAVFFMAKRGYGPGQHCLPNWKKEGPCQTDKPEQ